MKGIVSFCLLAVVGCKNEPAASPVAQAPLTVAKAESVPREAPAAAKVRAFIAYQRGYLTLMHTPSTPLDALEAAPEPPLADLPSVAEVISAAADMGIDLPKKLAALRAKYELGPKELVALGELANSIVRKSSPTALAPFAKLDQMEASLPRLPDDARPALEATVARLKAQRAELQTLKNERDLHGDALVDAMLAQKDALPRLLPAGDAAL
ncbi:MAG: hypothetical protein RL385_1141 [Pseudomonadota bacterium]|jgi:hypothetical protein